MSIELPPRACLNCVHVRPTIHGDAITCQITKETHFTKHVCSSHEFSALWQSTTEDQPEPTSIVSQTVQDRSKIYGPPQPCHHNIGLTWTALLQQHYGLFLDHPVPDFLVAQMMAALKLVRASKTYHADNYTDAIAYTGFADEFQNTTKGQSSQPG